MKSKDRVCPGGMFTENSLRSSEFFSSSVSSSLFSDSSNSSSSKVSSFFSFSKGLIVLAKFFLSFSLKTNLKSFSLISLFKLTMTQADNFDLFLKDRVLVEGSLKLTPPKSNLSSTIITSGCTMLA